MVFIWTRGLAHDCPVTVKRRGVNRFCDFTVISDNINTSTWKTGNPSANVTEHVEPGVIKMKDVVPDTMKTIRISTYISISQRVWHKSRSRNRCMLLQYLVGLIIAMTLIENHIQYIIWHSVIYPYLSELLHRILENWERFRMQVK